MIWTSYNNKESKLKCNFNINIVAFNLFDFDRNRGFMEGEMITIFVNTCVGICRLVRSPIPEFDALVLVARKAFDMADVNNDTSIEYIEYDLTNFSIVNWAEGRSEFVKFLARYEPSIRVIVKDEIFNDFPKYSSNNFIEETLYFTVNFNSIRKRIVFITTSHNCFHDAS